jgi:NAD(P)H dehydrogenase (quinone)
MNALVVYAHPEPRSLTGSLKDHAVRVLEREGHEVRVSDLYAMGWKALADHEDFLDHGPEERLQYILASGRAYEGGSQAPDIVAEQEKLLWADFVLVHFPMWWFTMPAILKGWVERVYAYGFAYGVGEHNDEHYGDRFGEGKLAGRRSMLVVTAGGDEPSYSARGVNGPMEDLLFPIQHGVLFYPGMEVLPPFVIYKSDHLDSAAYPEVEAALEERLLTIESTEPIPFRMQNAGEYEIPSLVLKEHVETDGAGGFGLHVENNRGAVGSGTAADEEPCE